MMGDMVRSGMENKSEAVPDTDHTECITDLEVNLKKF